MKLKANHWLPKLLGVNAITLYPFVFTAMKKPTRTLLYHEWTHCEQVKNVGWLRFYISYLLYYCAHRTHGFNAYFSYKKIPFETDAFMQQGFYYSDKDFLTWLSKQKIKTL